MEKPGRNDPCWCGILFYQLFGSLGEWAWTGSAAAALQDIRIGLPGMLAQVFAGYAVLRYLLRN